MDEDDPASAFVHCLQNHDQVGNRPLGERLHHLINSDRYKVASVLLLFDPETPLIFMGQEFAASTPFCFFTDMPEELGKMVTEGRRREFSGFAAFSDPATRDSIPDPQVESTFMRSKLRLEERDTHGGIYRLYRDLIQLRRSQPAMRSTDRRTCVATAMGAELIQVVRSANGQELMLRANFVFCSRPMSLRGSTPGGSGDPRGSLPEVAACCPCCSCYALGRLRPSSPDPR
ncbi:MAG: DUF3459 domain-containing protein [Thermomicrobiales bacterium]|nr:DUF3459 domain-containing protein [Thermomicrobiales bacterium]